MFPYIVQDRDEKLIHQTQVTGNMNTADTPVGKHTGVTGTDNTQQVTRFSIRVYTYPASRRRRLSRDAAAARHYLDRKQPGTPMQPTPVQPRTLVIEQFKQIDNVSEEK